MDLVVAGEWMPVTIYLNQMDGWKQMPISGSSGLWQTLAVADVNQDGQPDILAGNWGLNTKLAAGKESPLKMYVHDFDKNGREEQIVVYTVKGKEYTFLAKDELERAVPVLKRGYLTYKEVAGETVQYLFYDLFKGYREWKAETLASALFINNGKGGFLPQELPREWQVAPIFSFLPAANGKSIYAGGNFYGVMPYEGRYNALFFSSFVFGVHTTKPLFEDYIPDVKGEVRDAEWILINKEKAMVLARNSLPLLLLKPISKE
jgi:hypothetical protein